MAQTVTTVSKATFLADALLFLRNDLRDNVTDPISALRTAPNQWVMTSYPQRPTLYPIITVKYSNVEPGSRLGMQSEQYYVTLKFEVRIWARKISEREEISQNVMNRLIDNSYPTSTSTTSSAVQIYGPDFGSTVDVDEEGDAGIHSRIINVSYTYVLA